MQITQPFKPQTLQTLQTLQTPNPKPQTDMPVVIEEMTVQVEVNQHQNADTQPEQSARGAAGNPQTDMIRQCVEEVMEVLRHQNER